MELRRRTKAELAIILTIALLLAVVATMRAQTCSPPLYQGNVNSCQGINIKFLNRNTISDIDRFTVRWNADGVTHTLPSSALGDSRTGLSCNWSSSITITQYLRNGASCITNSTGSAPHTFPCSLCVNSGAGFSVVSAANFRGSVSRGSLVSLFPDPGTTFTDQTQHASSINLPYSLGGVTADVDGYQCGLLDVAPTQINLLLPYELPEGPAELSMIVNTTRGTTARFSGRPQVNPSAPGIFTQAANGEGQAASLWFVARLNGTQGYYLPGQLPTLSATDTVVLVLYATGANPPAATLYLSSGRSYDSLYCGASGFAGVQQINLRIPTAEVWRSTLGAFVRVWKSADHSQGGWDSQGFDLR